MFHRSPILILVAAAVLAACGTAAQAAEAPGSEGFALVELFTSQGCSSCPPADRVLASLSERAHTDGARVYALSFHVDYWNSLGWKDPYSQTAFTERQRAYAGASRSGRVYTPQMVVNGQVEFIGSNRPTAEQAVRSALARQPRGRLEVAAKLEPAAKNGQVQRTTVAVTSADLPTGSVIHIALVQASASNHVPRGENSGRKLQHHNVVRQLVTFTPGNSKEAGQTLRRTIELPADLKPEAASVIVFAQSPATMHVHCAAAAQLSAP